MQKTRAIQTIVLSTVVGGFFLAGCLPTSSTTSEPQASTNPATTTEKSGVTTMRGTLQVTGKTAVLKTATSNVEVSSYDLDLSTYNGKTVSVTGKFSGDTLFASSITE